MTDSDILHRTTDHLRQMMQGEGSGHDWHHTDRVRRMALRLAIEEKADPFVVELAALLHDVADHKFHGGDLEAGPRAARAWLESCGLDEVRLLHVCSIIRHLSFKGAGVPTPMETLEGRVVQDADRLDALGAIGIARTFAYGGHVGHPLHDPDLASRQHGSFEEYRSSRGTSINHFYEKLLLLRDRMNTKTARRLAADRHRVLEEFLQRFLAEWEGQV